MDRKTKRRYDSQRKLSDKAFKSGCYAPFMSLYFNTLGDVTACCRNQTSPKHMHPLSPSFIQAGIVQTSETLLCRPTVS